MEEAFTKDFFQFRHRTPGRRCRNRRDEPTAPIHSRADDELVEEAVNGVHEEHEGKGQHKEHAENNQRTVMSELVKRSVFDVLAVCSAVATTRSLVNLWQINRATALMII